MTAALCPSCPENKAMHETDAKFHNRMLASTEAVMHNCGSTGEN